MRLFDHLVRIIFLERAVRKRSGNDKTMTKCDRKNGKKGRGNARHEAMIATKNLYDFSAVLVWI